MNGEAEYLLNNDLLKEIFDKLESDALETAVNAPLIDDETRRIATGEVRAIRSVRRKLKALCAPTIPRTGSNRQAFRTTNGIPRNAAVESSGSDDDIRARSATSRAESPRVSRSSESTPIGSATVPARPTPQRTSSPSESPVASVALGHSQSCR